VAINEKPGFVTLEVDNPDLFLFPQDRRHRSSFLPDFFFP